MAFVGRRTWSLRTSFWLVVGAQVLLFAGSNFPTPLFPIYEQRYGFGSGVVTLLFGIYVAALIPVAAPRPGGRPGRAPPAAGRRDRHHRAELGGLRRRPGPRLALRRRDHLRHRRGHGDGLCRRRHPGTAPPAGRQGGGAGGVRGRRRRADARPPRERVPGVGTPWPTVSPFVLDIVAASVLAAALLRIPETRPPKHRDRAADAHHPRPRRDPVRFVAAAVAGAASFMVVGWVFGLSPSYLHEELGIHITQPVVAGLFAALVMLTNGAAQLILRRHHNPAALRVALGGVVVGMGVMAASTLVNSLGRRHRGRGDRRRRFRCGPDERHGHHAAHRAGPCPGRRVSAYFTLCYLALSVPVIIAGVTADRVRARPCDRLLLRRPHRPRAGRGAAVDPARREPRDRHRGGADRAPRATPLGSAGTA